MTDSVEAQALRQLIERIETLEEEKKGIAEDIRDVYTEAKSRGYCPKTIKALIKLRAMEAHHRQEAEALLETYRAAIGL